MTLFNLFRGNFQNKRYFEVSGRFSVSFASVKDKMLTV